MRSEEPVSRGRRQYQRRLMRPRTRRTRPGNPVTPTDYAGSREGPPHSWTRHPPNRRVPTRPAPTDAPADAYQPDSSRLSAGSDAHHLGDDPSAYAPSAAVIVGSVGRTLLYAGKPNRSLLDPIPH